jgi:hypothetical protein
MKHKLNLFFEYCHKKNHLIAGDLKVNYAGDGTVVSVGTMGDRAAGSGDGV